MRYSFYVIVIATILIGTSVWAQNTRQPKLKIVEYIRMISEGRNDLVSRELPSLQTKLRNTPDVSYIEGLLATDGTTAIQYFRMVTDSFPSSEWADDALMRMAEIYSLSGMRRPMEENISRLRVQYPESPYITTNYVKEISDVPDDSEPVTLGPSENEYAIQVGAFSVRENAEKLQQRMKTEGFQADIFENFLDGKNLLYLVWVGSLRTRGDIQKTMEAIQHKLGIKGILRTRSSWKRW